jgi:AmmeMemoRadiSam system protein B
MNPEIRHSAVAGRFYPGARGTLLADVKSYLATEKSAPAAEPQPAIGCLVPHAGYIYSGRVAGAVYARVAIPSSVIVLCPNHTGRGEPLAVMNQGAWETPLGAVPVDAALAAAVQQHCPALHEDREAHRFEHAIEVQLPFLQVQRPDVRIVPIVIGTGRFDILAALGEALAAAIPHGDALLVASSDMNHYESDALTRQKDHMAIERLLALDARGLFDVVHREDISMCGYGPAVVMLTAARRLGAQSASLIEYATSGDVSGDREQVVGYAGVVVH